MTSEKFSTKDNKRKYFRIMLLNKATENNGCKICKREVFPCKKK